MVRRVMRRPAAKSFWRAAGTACMERSAFCVRGVLVCLCVPVQEMRRGNLLGGEAGDVRVEGAADDEERAVRLEEAEAAEDQLRRFVGHLRARCVRLRVAIGCRAVWRACTHLQRDVVVVLLHAEAARLALDADLGEREALQEADGLRAR